MNKTGRRALVLAALMIAIIAIPIGAMAAVSGSMTASDFISKAVDGVITLTGNVTITNELEFTSDMKVNLAGHTLTLGHHDNKINNGNITFENGSIVADNLTAYTNSNGGIIKIGNYSNASGSLTLDKVEFSVSNSDTILGTFILYGKNSLTIKNGSKIAIINEKNTDNGNIVYSNAGKDGAINISDSTVIAENGNSGFYGGTIRITNSTIDLDTKKHGFNGGVGYLDAIITDSNVEMDVGKRGVTIYPDSTFVLAGNTVADIHSDGTGAIVYYDGETEGVSVGDNATMNLSGKNKLVLVDKDDNSTTSEEYSKYIDFGNNVLTIINGEVFIGNPVLPAGSVDVLPQTGDNSHLLFSAALLALSVASLTVRRRRSER